MPWRHAAVDRVQGGVVGLLRRLQLMAVVLCGFRPVGTSHLITGAHAEEIWEVRGSLGPDLAFGARPQ